MARRRRSNLGLSKTAHVEVGREALEDAGARANRVLAELDRGDCRRAYSHMQTARLASYRAYVELFKNAKLTRREVDGMGLDWPGTNDAVSVASSRFKQRCLRKRAI